MKKRECLGGYPPDRFEHISFRRPVSLIQSEGTWKDMKAKWKEMNTKWKDMNAKWKEHERKWMQNERRWKEKKTKDDICWLSTKDAFTPTEKKAGKFALLVYRELTTWKQNDKSKNKRERDFGSFKKIPGFYATPCMQQGRTSLAIYGYRYQTFASPRCCVLRSPSRCGPGALWPHLCVSLLWKETEGTLAAWWRRRRWRWQWWFLLLLSHVFYLMLSNFI